MSADPAEPRRLRVFGPPSDGRVAEQLARLQTDSKRAEERDVELEEAGGEQFAVVLVGRDGTEKQRWTEPVAPEAVWAAVDALPMRRAEMRAQAEERTES